MISKAVPSYVGKFSKLLSSPSGVLCPFQVKCALVIKLLPGKFVSTDVCGKFLVVCLFCLLGGFFLFVLIKFRFSPQLSLKWMVSLCLFSKSFCSMCFQTCWYCVYWGEEDAVSIRDTELFSLGFLSCHTFFHQWCPGSRWVTNKKMEFFTLRCRNRLFIPNANVTSSLGGCESNHTEMKQEFCCWARGAGGSRITSSCVLFEPSISNRINICANSCVSKWIMHNMFLLLFTWKYLSEIALIVLYVISKFEGSAVM